MLYHKPRHKIFSARITASVSGHFHLNGSPSGDRFPVTLVDGKLQRDSKKTDRRKGVPRRSPTPSGDTIPISSPKCVPEPSITPSTK